MKRCTRCDAALTCAACDARFDDLLKQNAQLKEALATLLPLHSSWCMGHVGGVKDGVGVGPLVVVDCRCEPKVQRARALLERG